MCRVNRPVIAVGSFVATSGQKPWPSAGSFVAAYGQFFMAADIWICLLISGFGVRVPDGAQFSQVIPEGTGPVKG